MDDGDLNENIGDYTQAIDGDDGEKHAERHSAIGGDQIHVDPSRWWFASSAFPMIAGTLGPVASAFSICALVRPWRQHIQPGSTITQADFITDPIWLTVLNAVQLVIALIANVFLLLNMAKRVRFSIAQPITIAGWYVSALCLVALSATASGPLLKQPVIEYVWSEAFYYGVYAAILYFVVASLMVVTVWGARAGHYPEDFELSTSQRTLMLQTIMFLMYLLVGALVFSKIEGWNYLDTVYWCDVTLFTVGYGDYSPATTLGRALLIPYALIGIISLGLVIGSIRSLMLDRGKRRLDARMLEKKRRQLLRHMRRSGKEALLQPIGSENQDGPTNWKSSRKPPRTEFERRQREFELMRKIQDKAATRRRWMALAASSTTWLVLWFVGAKIFQVCELPYQPWSYFDGFYFAFTGLTTIGYGDLTPMSNSGRAFFVFWSLLALPATTVLISNAGDTIVKVVRDGTLKLGNLTILPGEHGFKNEAKEVMSKLSFGAVFKEEDVEESPPGFLGAAQPHSDEDDDDDDYDEDDEIDVKETRGYGSYKDGVLRKTTSNSQSEPASQRGGSTNLNSAAVPTRSQKEAQTSDARNNDNKFNVPNQLGSMAREDIPSELPKTRSEYHLVLIDEISRVTKHLQGSPPRKYTFKEWAWYLRLMGEDESSAETHRKPAQKPRGKDAHDAVHVASHGQTLDKSHKTADTPLKPPGEHDEAKRGDDDKLKWSWVGHRSPLMDTREEAEWILDRLEQKLRDELQAMVKEGQGSSGLLQVRREEDDNEHETKEKDPGVMGGD
ncbi:uncharacterized protein BCR38DRAFT_467141 [Pseudomassariella vexata]|uniref:Potassium channel domain-containing protein n=1 Tax=Pseudomassariella vexata TaxID=1141098 RepID=A0A1Y2DTT1_9PEZI|nr:uncharacterized protein BCR38DRAFT_467141 [Pseudomassariella vexata]ORY62546.1 hypothetical protein BCR38DRAFT_467141 [Pseudomassariella vexata]